MHVIVYLFVLYSSICLYKFSFSLYTVYIYKHINVHIAMDDSAERTRNE